MNGNERCFKMYLKSMYYILYLLILIISLTNAQSPSLCTQYYPYDAQQQQCECEDKPVNGISHISLKCLGHSYVPQFLTNIHYYLIELESCSQDLQIGDKTFADLNINSIRLRHCNLIGLNEESFSKINHLEKFLIENSTINSLSTSTGNFQEIFQSDSFRTLKSLTLKNIHYHQLNKHDKKLNLELLLNKLPQLHRLELINIYLDNYRYTEVNSIGQHLTYLRLINTHQTSLLPIEYLSSLERLILSHLPDIFQSQPLIASIQKLKKIKYLDFSHNQLTNINDLQSRTIDQIDLTANLIEFIDEYTFEHVPKLQTLTLTGNPLKSIDKNAFCGIKNLERLYINSQKENKISSLDNCILLNNPKLDIIQDSQIKIQCNCQLVNLFQVKRQQTKDINRSFNPNHVCIVTNNTLGETKNVQQLINHLNLPMHIYELENYLNCSLNDQCDRLCQDRKVKILKTTTTLSSMNEQKLNVNINKKTVASLSSSLHSFFSYTIFLLLLAFLYL